MIIRLIIIFLLVFASIWFGLQLKQDPGYLFIALNHWTIETTLWFALLICVLGFLLLLALTILLIRILHLPSAYHAWRHKRLIYSAQDKTRRGLIEFSEGYWSSAKKHLIKALPNADAPLLNYLTAARAAQEMGDNQLRDNFLREAQQCMPEAKIAVELTQAQLQMANEQWEQALATLKHLQDITPKHPYVLKLLMKLYQEVRDWQHLINLLPELQKHHIIPDTEFKKLLHNAYLQLLSDLVKQGQTDAINKFIANLPKTLKNDPDLMVEYCHFLYQDQQMQLAESILRRCLTKNQFNEKLINLYGQIPFAENQLVFAESLLKKHPNSAELMLCLGRLCVANHLWGKAKSYFEKSIALYATPQAYSELGKMLADLNDQAGACEAYRKGLALMS